MRERLCDKLCGTCPWCLGFITSATEKLMPAIPVKPFTDEWSLSKRGWWYGLDVCIFEDGSGGDAAKTVELLTLRLRTIGLAISYEEPQQENAQWFAFVEADDELGIIIETTTPSDSYAEWNSRSLQDAVALLVRLMTEPMTTEQTVALIRGAGEEAKP